MPASKVAKKSAKIRKPSTKILATAATESKPRRLHLPNRRRLFRRVPKSERPVMARLPNVWILTKKTSSLLWQHRWLFLGIAAIYAVLSIVFVRGVSGGTDVGSLKSQFGQALGGYGQLAVGVSVFTSLLSSSGNTSASASSGAYQTFLALVISLASIWVLRQLLAGEKLRLRDAFYKGMYPLVPFILVLVVVALQCLPFLIGGGLYSLVVTNGIAVYLPEKLMWGLLFFVLAIVSVYMLCSSLFAAYIVTLPDMTPMKALRSARQLVRYRRPAVFRKLLFLPVALLVIAAAIMVPIIIIAAPLAQWVFFALSMCALIVIHAYMYTLYREMLNDEPAS